MGTGGGSEIVVVTQLDWTYSQFSFVKFCQYYWENEISAKPCTQLLYTPLVPLKKKKKKTRLIDDLSPKNKGNIFCSEHMLIIRHP
jgi:hypothetical protein